MCNTIMDSMLTLWTDETMLHIPTGMYTLPTSDAYTPNLPYLQTVAVTWLARAPFAVITPKVLMHHLHQYLSYGAEGAVKMAMAI